jgi:hypothetical protein
MAANVITHPTPEAYLLGTQDFSAVVPEMTPPGTPQFLVKVYSFFPKGPADRDLLVHPSQRNAIYGEGWSDPTNPYWTHQTEVTDILARNGVSHVIRRCKPSDAGNPASLVLWAEVTDDLAVVLYERDPLTNMYVLDEDGLRIPTGSTAVGSVVRLYVEPHNYGTSGSPGPNWGEIPAIIGVGYKRYPVAEFSAQDYGTAYHSVGVNFWAQVNTSMDSVSLETMQQVKAFLYRIRMIQKNTTTGQITVKPTLLGSSFLELALKSDVSHPTYKNDISLGTAFIDNYQRLDVQGEPDRYSDIGRVHVYEENVQEIVEKLYATEKAYADEIGDFDGTDGQEHLINLLSLRSSSGVPYFTVVPHANSLVLTSNTALMLSGSSDGTMSTTQLDNAFIADMDNYDDPDHEYTSYLKHPERFIDDSGFGLAAKEAMPKFMALSKSRMVWTSTHIYGQAPLTAAQEISMGTYLLSLLSLFADSTYFATPQYRAMIFGDSGLVNYKAIKKHMPYSLDMVDKWARAFGAENGIFNANAVPDADELSVVTLFKDCNNSVVTQSARKLSFMTARMNRTQLYDKNRRRHWPGLRTITPNSTSTLLSPFNALVAMDLTEICQDVNRQLTGSIRFNQAQLVERANTLIVRRTLGRYAGLVRIVPACYASEYDQQLGYSLSFVVKMAGNNPFLAGTIEIGNYRPSQLTQA